MSTKVEAPAPRNIAQEAGDTLATQIRLAPEQLAAYQRTAPGYAQTDLNVLGQSLFGDGWTGTLSDINRRLTDEAGLQSRRANTLQREADLADVQRLSPSVLAAQRAANPELFANLDKLDQAAAFDVTPGRAEQMFGDWAAQAGPTRLETQLEQQAAQELALGDQLSPEEQRLVRVQSRAAANARGRGFSNAALADEVLNTSTARQARADARRGFALTTNNALRAGQGADRSFLGQAAQFEAARRGEGFNRRLSATQARLATFADPFQGVLGRSSANVGTNANLFGNAVGTAGASAQQTRGMFEPFNPYAADVYNTNYNAQAAANIATANNRAGLIGAGIGAIGSIAGGFASRGCWVARAVYGERDSRWRQFRTWLLSRAPQHLLARYLARGQAAAERVKRDPVYRAEMRALMDAVLELQPA